MPIVNCSTCFGRGKKIGGQHGEACSLCGGSGVLNAPTDETFKKHFFENGTYLGRFQGQDYFRSDGGAWGVGPKPPCRKKFDVNDWK